MESSLIQHPLLPGGEQSQVQKLVSLEGVSKIYPSSKGDVYAVRDVTLDVQAGEFFSLLGSSGSGKTTTLRLIGGFEIPEYGQVFLGGEDVTPKPPYLRDVHTVFQKYALFPQMSVAQNIAYPLSVQRVAKDEINRRVGELLKMFQIEGLGDRFPSQLSGGQQQRVALARALINRPKVLLLDEPLSALDAKIREEVRQELRDLQRKTNITFIYVTHDQEEALALSDRIAVMHDGKVEQIGTPEEIYSHPATRFVAQFIGKANFLSGTALETSSDSILVDVNGVKLQAISHHYKPTTGESVTLMIRPEQFRIGSNPEAVNQITGKVNSITYIGQLVEYRVNTDIGMLTVTQLGGRGNYPKDSSLELHWQTNDCIVLP
jgi:spermidine/putrescine ABC transporter ATP-binding subunit